jgi:hypothetical protein
MRSLAVRFGAAAALLTGGLLLSPAAQAAPVSSGIAPRAAADALDLV